MSGDTDRPQMRIREPPVVLVPVAVLEGQTVPETVVDFLAPARVVILGYHVLPDQTSTEQASLQFEDRAQQAVETIAETFRAAGGDPETRVVFTHDRDQTVDRVAADIGATATLLTNPTAEIRDVLVPLRGAVDQARLADLVATLLVDGEHSVTLWGIDTDDPDFDAGAAVENVRNRLDRRGVLAEQVDFERSSEEAPLRAIVERSAEFDAIVMGAGEESLVTVLLGEDEERVADAAVAPVLVVHQRPENE
ncbi:universal stress protein [Salinibaculum rarum]|uniref:universal stress protein n=1 Tax=Salinibaculum rarum TaxID=3058903 RepID=UPI00265F67E6|nr:universal stress protein [Salinibaculum sp. KK48]